MKYAIKVVQKNDDENYLREANGAISGFPSYAAAMRQHEFMSIGMKGDVQSINVVKYPKKAAVR